ncbi:MAG: T9SS type A sorting domain-containing protein, partial [Bacteroidota bacterium]|nr:T9SS type A sorting domain-containing protein [Bacteroidota bacterium]
ANLRFVTLRVYDILGKEIATLVSGWKSPGTYNVDFDGSMLSSGTYIYRLEASHYTMSRMMTLLK